MSLLTSALTYLTAALFSISGYGLLNGLPLGRKAFDAIGWGDWFRYVTAVIQLSAVVALLVSTTAGLGALLLACVMGCAVYANIRIIKDNPTPSIVLFALTCVVTALHWDSLTALAHR